MSDLRAEVAIALNWDLSIPRNRVTVEVDHGVVTLRGCVERAYQKSHAEAIARRLLGVIGVMNEVAVLPTNLAVTEPPPFSLEVF